MTTTSVVNILDGNQLLETRLCRRVRLPDGRPGAIWRGMAYPLEDGERIDVSAPGVTLGACLAALDGAPEEVTYRLIEGEEEAWLLLVGSVTARDAAASRLAAAGLTVLRTGRWFGDAADGLAADWFVRFLRPSGDVDLGALLARTFDLAPPARTSDVELRVQVLQAELAATRSREARLRAELTRLRAAATGAAGAAAEAAALRAELEEERALRAEAEALVQAQATAAPTHPAERPGQPRPSPQPPRRLQEEVRTVIETLLPRTRLLRDSLTVASAEFRDRTALYRALHELQQGALRLPTTWKKLRGVEAWWERHVSNGEDDAGRVYARHSAAEQRWEVLVSHKAEQDRDIAWLRRQ